MDHFIQKKIIHINQSILFNLRDPIPPEIMENINSTLLSMTFNIKSSDLIDFFKVYIYLFQNEVTLCFSNKIPLTINKIFSQYDLFLSDNDDKPTESPKKRKINISENTNEIKKSNNIIDKIPLSQKRLFRSNVVKIKKIKTKNNK